MKMTTAQFETHQDDNDGYCTNCDRVTTQDVEPDAEGYECSECGKETVMGVDNAIILEHIEISDEDGDEDFENGEEDEGGSFL